MFKAKGKRYGEEDSNSREEPKKYFWRLMFCLENKNP